MSEHNTYRDGRIHVLNEKCATCIFKPKTRPVSGKRVAELVKETIDDDGASVICHHTLGQSDEGEFKNAICRGWYDRFAEKDKILELAKAMNLIKKVSLLPFQK